MKTVDLDKVQKYYVDFGTGTGNFEFEGTLEKAVKAAIGEIAYTPQDIEIKDEDGDVVATSKWCSTPDKDDDAIATFGKSGFYTPFVTNEGFYINSQGLFQ